MLRQTCCLWPKAFMPLEIKYGLTLLQVVEWGMAKILTNVILGLMVAGFGIGRAVADTELVPAGSTWRYLDDGTNQGTAWREVAFADTAWAQGPAQLGYGDGDEATVVGYGPDPNTKYVTTYFRHSFEVTDPAEFVCLRLSLLRDDGAVVYLNGAEIGRSNMPDGAIDYLTHASSAVASTEESLFQPPSLRVESSNLLAQPGCSRIGCHDGSIIPNILS